MGSSFFFFWETNGELLFCGQRAPSFPHPAHHFGPTHLRGWTHPVFFLFLFFFVLSVFTLLLFKIMFQNSKKCEFWKKKMLKKIIKCLRIHFFVILKRMIIYFKIVHDLKNVRVFTKCSQFDKRNVHETKKCLLVKKMFLILDNMFVKPKMFACSKNVHDFL